MTCCSLTRRQLATVLVGASVGLSGCLGGSDDSPDGENSGPPDYADWLPEREPLGYSHYSFNAVSYEAIRANEDALDSGVYQGFVDDTNESFVGDLGLSFADLSSVVSAADTEHLSGSFDRSTVVDALGDTEMTEQQDHLGYTLYASGYQGVAVGDGELVVTQQSFGTGTERVVELLQVMLDAGNGEGGRQIDANEDFEALVSALGDGDFASGRTMETRESGDPEDGWFAGIVARGTSVALGSPTSKATYADVFATESDVDMDAVTTWSESERRFVDAGQNIQTTQDGRTATLEVDFRTSLSGFRQFLGHT